MRTGQQDGENSSWEKPGLQSQTTPGSTSRATGTRGQPQETGWTSLDPHVVTVEMDTAARRPQAAVRVTDVPV